MIGSNGIPDPEDAEPFEEEETAEEDLWFLPGPDPEEDLPPGATPEPRREFTPLFDPAPWAAAQAELAMELAEVAQLYGALDQRLRLAAAAGAARGLGSELVERRSARGRAGRALGHPARRLDPRYRAGTGPGRLGDAAAGLGQGTGR